MRRLLGVELTRVRSRRLVWLLLLLGYGITLLAVGATVYDSRPLGAPELARAEALAEREAQRPYVQRDLARCERNPERFGGSDFDCAELRPTADWFLQRQQLDLAEVAPEILVPTTVLFAVLALLIGATTIGADWAAGSLSTHLVFEPRRTRVYVSRVLAVAAWSALAAAVALLVVLGTLAVFAATWGTYDVSGAFAERLGWQVLRGLLGVAAAGMAGFAIAMGARHTAATLGIVVGYFLVGELLLRSLWPSAEKLLLSNHVAAWLLGRHQAFIFDESRCGPMGGGDCSITFNFGQATAGWYLAGLTAVALLGAWALFNRRDVA